MTFDLVIGNPPYQESHNTGSPIWQNFVLRNLNLVCGGGRMAMIHPPRWRGVGMTNPRSVGELGKILKSLDMEWLEIHDHDAGKRMFGVGTRFDVYVLRKDSTPGFETEIEDERGGIRRACLREMDSVPNFECGDLDSLLAKDGEERVVVLLDRAKYQAIPANSWMSREQSDEFRFPCVYSIGADGNPAFKWSNEDRGHFGIPKVIIQVWHAAGPPIVDADGEFGMTQTAAGIADDPEVLPLIAKAMDSPRFRECMQAVQFDTYKWNAHVIRLLRKDFWRVLL